MSSLPTQVAEDDEAVQERNAMEDGEDDSSLGHRSRQTKEEPEWLNEMNKYMKQTGDNTKIKADNMTTKTYRQQDFILSSVFDSKLWPSEPRSTKWTINVMALTEKNKDMEV